MPVRPRFRSLQFIVLAALIYLPKAQQDTINIAQTVNRKPTTIDPIVVGGEKSMESARLDSTTLGAESADIQVVHKGANQNEADAKTAEVSGAAEASKLNEANKPQIAQPNVQQPTPNSNPQTAQPTPNSNPQTAQPNVQQPTPNSNPQTAQPNVQQPTPNSNPQTAQPNVQQPTPNSNSQQTQQRPSSDQTNFQEDTKPSKTEEVKVKETKQLAQTKSLMETSPRFHETIFEMNTLTEQFIIKPSGSQHIFIQVTVYVKNDDHYGLIEDVESTLPLKLFVFQGSNRIISQTSCYFGGSVEFQAQPSQTYTLRLYNEGGGHKLIIMQHSQYLSAHHFATVYDSEKHKQHHQHMERTTANVRATLSTLRRTKTFFLRDNEVLTQTMDSYFGYQVTEVVIVAVVAFIQLELVKRMFRTRVIL